MTRKRQSNENIEYLEEGHWVYMRSPADPDKFTFARLERSDLDEPFSRANSAIYVPGEGVFRIWDPKDIIMIFPKVKFKPIHILIGKIASEETGGVES